MAITQTVEIPASYKLTLDVPREIPTGRTIITFTPAPVSKRKPISMYLGIISPDTYGDGLLYQKKLREEWNG